MHKLWLFVAFTSTSKQYISVQNILSVNLLINGNALTNQYIAYVFYHDVEYIVDSQLEQEKIDYGEM